MSNRLVRKKLLLLLIPPKFPTIHGIAFGVKNNYAVLQENSVLVFTVLAVVGKKLAFNFSLSL